MCTVTILVLGTVPDGGYRLITNRDEQRTRPPALPPHQLTCGGRQAIMPIDPVANGTWVGVNDAGLCVTLLNLYPPSPVTTAPPKGERRSRGRIVRELLACGDATEAFEQVRDLPVVQYPPFCLLAVDSQRLRGWRWSGAEMTAIDHPLAEAPFLFASSGLGDHLVVPPRTRLFEEMIVGTPPAVQPRRQDAFHRHRWVDQPHLSVCMAREDARTVSVTTVEVGAGTARLAYHAGPPDEAADEVVLSLPIASPPR